MQGTSEVLAVAATNIAPSAASWIMSGVIAYDDGSTASIKTDGTWKGLVGQSPPNGFQNPSFDDSAWSSVRDFGAYPQPIWQNINIPLA